jgi:hypothetical protein
MFDEEEQRRFQPAEVAGRQCVDDGLYPFVKPPRALCNPADALAK